MASLGLEEDFENIVHRRYDGYRFEPVNYNEALDIAIKFDRARFNENNSKRSEEVVKNYTRSFERYDDKKTC